MRNKLKVSHLPSLVDIDGGPYILVDTPPWTTPSTSFNLTGRYFCPSPTSLDYSLDNGSTWTTATAPSIGNGQFQILVSAGVSAATYIPKVRDTNHTYRIGTAGNFHVNAWIPSALPGITACFDPNDFANTPVNGDRLATLNYIYDPTKFLQQNTQSLSPFVVRNSGAHGKHRTLKFQTTYTISGHDFVAHWLPANGPNGSFPDLVHLADSVALNQGTFTGICAGKIDRQNPYHCFFIWGRGNADGASPVWQQVRMNQLIYIGAQGFASTATGYNAAYTTLVNGWHTMAVVKNAGTVTFYLDGTAVATSTTADVNPFALTQTDADFVLGGSIGSNNAIWTGMPPPEMGGSIFTSTALSGSDLTNATAWVAATCGLS